MISYSFLRLIVNLLRKDIVTVIVFVVRMSVKAFELVPAIERINLLSDKASTQVC